MDNYLIHFGIPGMHWGIRRYQNQDGTLTEAGKKRYLKSNGEVNYRRWYKDQKRLEKQDLRWAHKNEKRITRTVQNRVAKEYKAYKKQYLDKQGLNKNGQLYINKANQHLAQLMNKAARDIESPSGKVVQFVAKRGNHELGTYMALATRDYDMSKVKSGVYGSGRVAYKKDYVERG